ncbi:hypothetical protein PAAG_07650 [Paracoccidioides lutzii Pb01]|uniref:Uncharacterized protein n=1 Tax=Paracoccidioides lutzii (strain ATCC MYA-826 / Pb01) TaxID=502779 RepID=C1HAJ6_PARBA|nr:hypothetical protein PAAG_07650 [Paracoccidioides lutzii Pb01]EEH37369.2 hypothetical protein PAAG_07650 [Paracoccidioides lutzii Pb01]
MDRLRRLVVFLGKERDAGRKRDIISGNKRKQAQPPGEKLSSHGIGPGVFGCQSHEGGGNGGFVRKPTMAWFHRVIRFTTDMGSNGRGVAGTPALRGGAIILPLSVPAGIGSNTGRGKLEEEECSMFGSGAGLLGGAEGKQINYCWLATRSLNLGTF